MPPASLGRVHYNLKAPVKQGKGDFLCIVSRKSAFWRKADGKVLFKLFGIQENAFPAQLVPAEFSRKLPGGNGFIPLDHPRAESQRADEPFRGDAGAKLP